MSPVGVQMWAEQGHSRRRACLLQQRARAVGFLHPTRERRLGLPGFLHVRLQLRRPLAQQPLRALQPRAALVELRLVAADARLHGVGDLHPRRQASVPAQMWMGGPGPGEGEPSPSAGEAAASPFPMQPWNR